MHAEKNSSECTKEQNECVESRQKMKQNEPMQAAKEKYVYVKHRLVIQRCCVDFYSAEIP